MADMDLNTPDALTHDTKAIPEDTSSYATASQRQLIWRKFRKLGLGPCFGGSMVRPAK